ncbi:hypothetical protein [Campylobacter geochelonis]|uniref:Lipoprotein n=1 Tax=Campylobacter geochelonis TaxID=1780362 RepID=A0A128ECI9_9BACT|nr:hypothetical protein [Campylobacter geochelonis]QKF70538.1 hypothetical protein CGEO_0205 [Campylobacter geochelonis]CZE46082.1 Uncharacterised protein [Campylobacter geochelonis]CZE46554.1 Uncharacterised protein [Campylobacter geochelonis]CZE50420.1 Uncharacterised protein [Campylobacter geochelonis]
MKKIISFLAVLLFFTGCAKTVEYNKNLEVAGVNQSLVINSALQKTYIFMDALALKPQSIASSTALGEDDLEINVGEFVQNESLRFFKNYLSNLEVTSNKEVLSSPNLIIMPEIQSFSYGFYSSDGFDIDSKPFVSYALNVKIFKNGKQIYSKNISTNERNYGEKTFFGMGDTSYAQIGPIFQKAIANDYNANATDIINSINSAK